MGGLLYSIEKTTVPQCPKSYRNTGFFALQYMLPCIYSWCGLLGK
jgi:hypothetical protein